MYTGPNIVTNGLVMMLDAANVKSYPGSGTTWNDLSGNGYSGSLTNGPTFSSTNGGSVLFNGSNNYIDFGTSGKDQVRLATSLSICANFYCTGFSNLSGGYSWAPIVAIDRFSSGTNYRKFALVAQNNAGGSGVQSIEGDFFDGVGNSKSVVYNTTVLNNFFSVIATINSSNTILYVNGVAVNQTTGMTVNSNPQTADFTIGARINTTYNGYFKGNIYNVQIYNRALSADEILQNYNGTKSRFGL